VQVEAVLALATAIVASLALTPLAKRAAWKCGAVCRPDGERKLQSRPTPLLGGVSLYLSMFFATAAALGFAVAQRGFEAVPLYWAFTLSAGLLCLLGCWDDLRDLPARWKLLGQIVSTLPIVLAGCFLERLVIFGCSIEMGWLGAVWTIGWLVLGINALNLLDGMDGLAAAIGLVVSMAIAVIAGLQGQAEVAVLAMAIGGGLLGFLVYNRPPARIYLGDCGSMVIGLTLSLLALEVARAAPAGANVSVLVALLFVPLLDTALAIVRRRLSGRSFMAADRGHIHHRLLDRGLGVWKVLVLLGGICLTTCVVACLAAVWHDEFWAWAALGVLMILLVNLQLVGYEEWTLLRRLLGQMAVRLVQRGASPGVGNRLRMVTPTPTAPPMDRFAGGGDVASSHAPSRRRVAKSYQAEHPVVTQVQSPEHYRLPRREVTRVDAA